MVNQRHCSYLPISVQKFILKSLQAHERLEDSKLEAVSDNNLELVNDILEDISPLTNKVENVAELIGILKEPHFLVIMIIIVLDPAMTA